MRGMGTLSTGIRSPSVRPASLWRRGAPLLLLIVAVVACGKGAGTDPTPVSQDAARKYAQCMRANGVTDFPDPGPDGRFREPSHEQRNDPTFVAATEACRALAPGGQHENTSDPAYVDKMREYAQCIRDHGVADFPDPGPDGRIRGPNHERQNDPKFVAANEACRSKLPGGGHQ
jgi:hypothetical protein